MDAQILTFFMDRGYRPMAVPSKEYGIFIGREAGFLSLVFTCDLRINPYISAAEFSDERKRCVWRLKDQGVEDIHVLSIVISDDANAAIELDKDNPYSWAYDSVQRQLVIPDGKTEDFYGIREPFSVWAKEEHDLKEIKDVKYTASGRAIRPLSKQPLVNHAVFAINILLFTFCTFTGRMVYNIGELSIERVMAGEWYRLITAIFLHGDIQHLLGNMIMLFYVGDMLENELGHKKFAILYFVAGIAGSLSSLAMQYVELMDKGKAVASIGASGALFGVMGAYLYVLFVNRKGGAKNSFIKVLFVVCYSLYGGMIATNVDNAAHVGGLIAGLILGIILYRRKMQK